MNKKTIRSNNMKKRIKDVYISLYKTLDINHITVKEICDKVNCNRGTFYLYYRDVYQLHEMVRLDILNEMKNKVDKLYLENNLSFNNIFSTLLSFYSDNEQILSLLITKDHEFYNEIKSLMKPTLWKVFNKDLSNNKYTDYLLEYHLSSIFGVLNYWVIHKDINIEEMFSLLREIITTGVFTVIEKID